jgi:hypothetical protein
MDPCLGQEISAIMVFTYDRGIGEILLTKPGQRLCGKEKKDDSKRRYSKDEKYEMVSQNRPGRWYHYSRV